MPSIQSNSALTHPGDVHQWHARQFPQPTDLGNPNSPSFTSSPAFIATIVLVVGFGVGFIITIVRKVRATQRIAPHPIVQAPPGAQRGPVIADILAGHTQTTTTNRLSCAHDNDRRSRTLSDGGLTQVDQPSRIIIHRDAGPSPRNDEAIPDELPPPYSSVGSP